MLDLGYAVPSGRFRLGRPVVGDCGPRRGHVEAVEVGMCLIELVASTPGACSCCACPPRRGHRRRCLGSGIPGWRWSGRWCAGRAGSGRPDSGSAAARRCSYPAFSTGHLPHERQEVDQPTPAPARCRCGRERCAETWHEGGLAPSRSWMFWMRQPDFGRACSLIHDVSLPSRSSCAFCTA